MQQKYPAVRLVVRHGERLAWIVPLLVAAAGLLCASLQSNAWLAAGVIAGALVLFCVLRVVVELVQIIAETLLPQ